MNGGSRFVSTVHHPLSSVAMRVVIPARRALIGAAHLCGVASIALALACSGHSPTVADGRAPRGAWGTDDVGLTVADSSATLLFLAAGGCYGSYGDIGQPIPAGAFTISGTYTQLIGASPGKLQYAAQYAGTVSGDRMSLTITVPALQRVLGPFTLTYGVRRTWNACLYP